MFNDPFDNRLDIQWTGSLVDIEDAARKQLIHLIEEENANLDRLLPATRLTIPAIRAMSPAERSVFLETLKESEGIYTQTFLEAMQDKLNKDIELFLSDALIFCLTEDHDNLVMWAHYADNHRGGVVKFLPVKEVDSPLLEAKNVIYSRNIPAIEYSNVFDNTPEVRQSIIDAFTLTKSTDWQYEREWRIVTWSKDPTKKSSLRPFAEKEVGGLYLGCRMCEADKSELIGIMAEKYPWAPIYQATPKRNVFSLAFEQIYYPA
jgi:hypothetical protein